MIGPRNPQGYLPLHASPSNQHILYGIIETVSYMENSSNIWRRNYYYIRLFPGIKNGSRISPEISILVPGADPTSLYTIGVKTRRKCLSHDGYSLSYFYLVTFSIISITTSNVTLF
jgi:hypothetical protein